MSAKNTVNRFIVALLVVAATVCVYRPVRAGERETITIEGVDRRSPRSAYSYQEAPDTVSFEKLLATGDEPLSSPGDTKMIYQPLADSRPINTFFSRRASVDRKTAVDEYGATEFFLISTGVAVLLFLSF